MRAEIAGVRVVVNDHNKPPCSIAKQSFNGICTRVARTCQECITTEGSALLA